LKTKAFIVGVCWCVLFSTSLQSYGQVIKLGQSDLSHVSNFVDYPTYPVTCLAGMYTDNHGQMWFHDCSIANTTNPGLYRFDGYEFEYVEFDNKLKSNFFKSYSNIIDDKIFGYVLTKTGTQLFYHDLDNKDIVVYDTLHPGQSSFKKDATMSVYYYQTIYKDTINSYSITKAGVTLNRYDKDARLIDTYNLSVANTLGVELYVGLENNPTYACYKNHFVYYNNKTHEVSLLNILTGSRQIIDVSEYINTKDNYYLQGQGNFLEFISKKNRYYFRFTDSTTLTLTYEEKLKDPEHLFIRYFEDTHGNVISHYANEGGDTIVLKTKEGITYDISVLTSYNFKGYQIKGRNFKEFILMHNGRNFYLFKFNLNPNIKKIPALSPTRSIVQPNDSTLFFLNERNHESELLTYRLDTATLDDTGLDCEFKFSDLEYLDTKLWGLGENSDFISYDFKTKECLAHNLPLRSLLALNDTELILIDLQYRFWKFNTQTLQKTLLPDGASPFTIESEYIEVVTDNAGVLWIASNLGLFCYNFETKTLSAIGDGLDQFNFSCVMLLDKDRLLLGSVKKGMVIYDIKSNTYHSLTTRNGLPNNSIATITKDMAGYFWVATYSGIALMDSDMNHIKNFYTKDGLSHNEANRKSALLLKDGRLAVGSMSGISILSTEQLTSKTEAPSDFNMYFTEIRYFNEEDNTEVNIDGGFDALKELTLSPSSRDLNFEFSTSRYINPRQTKYYYKIGEDQSNWKDLGTIPRLSFARLDAGTHNISIRGRDQDGNFTANTLNLVVVVEDHFYNTLWFYLLLLSAAALLVYFWVTSLKLQVKDATGKIEQQKLKLEELDKAKTRFFTNITHEFRTPLTIIKSVTDLIKSGNEQKHIKELHEIEKNSNELLNMVNQILDLRKLESGKMTLDLIQSDIISYIDYIVDSHQYPAQKKGITLRLIKPDLPVVMDFDVEKIKTILTNLISNAIKYTPKHGEISVRVKKHVDANSLLISIQDTGLGISDEDVEKVFEYFQQSDTLFKSDNSSGIGLNLTQQLVEFLGGSISIQSQQHEGTFITINLPVTNTAEKGSLSQQIVEPGQLLTTPNETETAAHKDAASLLIVEDNEALREILSLQLQQYRIYTASDGEEGERVAIEEVPDLIISDVMMPHKNGYELCENLKTDKRTSHIPIILLTAKADQPSKIEGLKAKADVYLNKPYDLEELKLNIKNLFERQLKLQQHFKKFDEESTPSDKPLEDQFILELRVLILNNLKTEDFGIPQICEQMKVSRTQLHNKLKALTGQTTSQFVMSIRLEKAEKLLRTTTKSIAQISTEAGINDSTYT